MTLVLSYPQWLVLFLRVKLNYFNIKFNFFKMISKIIKRNGEIVDFRAEKIQEAIAKAVQAVGGSDLETPKILTRLVVKEI